MKKLFTLGILILTGLLFVPVVQAETVTPQDGYYQDRNGRRDRGRHRGWERRTYVRNEYRYVQYGSRVYRETYRTTYLRNGRIISRVLVNRARVRNYDRNRSGFRFNIYIPF